MPGAVLVCERGQIARQDSVQRGEECARLGYGSLRQIGQLQQQITVRIDLLATGSHCQQMGQLRDERTLGIKLQNRLLDLHFAARSLQQLL